MLNTGALGSEMQALAQGLATGTSSSGAGDPPASTLPASSVTGDTLKSLGHHALSLLGADDDNAINTLLDGIKGAMHGHTGSDARPSQVANVPDVGGHHWQTDTVTPDLSQVAHGHHFEHLWS